MATYEITAPDGRKFRVTGEGTKEEALAQFQSQWAQMQGGSQRAEPEMTRAELEQQLVERQALSNQAQTDLNRLQNVANVAGVFEPFATAATAAVQTPLAGLRGLLTPTSQGMDAAADAVESQLSNIYQPQTPVGQRLMGAAAVPFELLDKYAFRPPADYIAEATGSPALGAALYTLPAAAAEIAGARGLRPSLQRQIAAPPPAPPLDNAAAARDLGLRLRPSDVAAANPARAADVPGQWRENLAGSSNLQRDFVTGNQATLTERAAREIGAPAGTTQITPELLDSLRAPHNQVYESVRTAIPEFTPSTQLVTDLDAVGTSRAISPAAMGEVERLKAIFSGPSSGAEALAAIADLRQRARANTRPGADGVRAEANYDIGLAQRQIANALESELERQLSIAPRAPGSSNVTLEQFRAARQALARIHNVEDATVAGQLDASELRRMKDRGAPLSGTLAQIADVAEAFPNVTRMPQRFPTPPSEPTTLAGWIRDIPGFFARRHLGGEGFQSQLGPQNGPIGATYRPEPTPAPAPEGLAGELMPRPTLALPPPTMVAGSRSAPGTMFAREQSGLTPDVERAGAMHPGAARMVQPDPRLLELPDLPPPGTYPGPMVVDPAGRVAPSTGDLQTYMRESGLGELAPSIVDILQANIPNLPPAFRDRTRINPRGPR